VHAGEDTVLPVHDVAERAPGRVGLLWTLVADGTFFVSLLFGYAFLATVAPGWPPPHWLASDWISPFAAAIALVLVPVMLRRAVACNSAGNGSRRQHWLAGAVMGSLASVVLVPLSVLPGLPSPGEHAYGAILAFTLAYVVFHTS